MDDTLALLRRIEETGNAASARGRDVLDVGPFRALLDPANDLIWLNYAVPIGPIKDEAAVASDLATLRRLFADHRRTPRFEFIGALWPGLPALLERAGLTLQAEQPLMACTPADFRPFLAPHVQVRLLDTTDPDRELAAYLRVGRQGFADLIAEPPTDPEVGEVARLRGSIQTGDVYCALASVDGAAAGAGCISSEGGLGELAGVATLPAYRRRGVASTLSSTLVADHFRRGASLVWLSAGDAGAEAVYARIGFRTVGTRLNYIEVEDEQC